MHSLGRALVYFSLISISSWACTSSDPTPSAQTQAPGNAGTCQTVVSGYGPRGSVPIQATKIVTGLEVPWGIGFLPSGDLLVTERPGRIRLVRGRTLVPESVADIQTGESTEGGVLGIAIDPAFQTNRSFYVFYTADKNGTNVNRVQRFILSADESKATPDRVLIDDIPAGTFHNGGRLRFGPDGDLYIGTGDSRNPDLAQDTASANGKILRIKTDGSIPSDNPDPSKPYFLLGIRNTEGFDWLADGSMIVTDNGPTGELGLSGQDKVSFAAKGDNLGWPLIHLCETGPDLSSPALAWVQANPPGGAAIYKGNAIPEWKGDLIMGVLGMDGPESHHLHRIVLAKDGSHSVLSHEVYFQGDEPEGFGRLRDVVTGPDGELYVTTSNCDSRGTCPPEKDMILKISRK